VHHQQVVTASFDDDTQIPRSARVAFKLNASQSVAGTAKFLAATEATNAVIKLARRIGEKTRRILKNTRRIIKNTSRSGENP
jgi:uncharacterized protein with HEPN domain